MSKIVKSYHLTEDDMKKIDEWYASLRQKIIDKQIETKFASGTPFMESEPYYGAIGGGLTISFTDTGLGVITVVKEAHTGEELNLTDYDSW